MNESERKALSTVTPKICMILNVRGTQRNIKIKKMCKKSSANAFKEMKRRKKSRLMLQKFPHCTHICCCMSSSFKWWYFTLLYFFPFETTVLSLLVHSLAVKSTRASFKYIPMCLKHKFNGAEQKHWNCRALFSSGMHFRASELENLFKAQHKKIFYFIFYFFFTNK